MVLRYASLPVAVASGYSLYRRASQAGNVIDVVTSARRGFTRTEGETRDRIGAAVQAAALPAISVLAPIAQRGAAFAAARRGASTFHRVGYTGLGYGLAALPLVSLAANAYDGARDDGENRLRGAFRGIISGWDPTAAAFGHPGYAQQAYDSVFGQARPAPPPPRAPEPQDRMPSVPPVIPPPDPKQERRVPNRKYGDAGGAGTIASVGLATALTASRFAPTVRSAEPVSAKPVGSGPVNVRAHTRKGKPVKASKRRLPTSR